MATYYMQVKSAVLPHLNFYQDDLLKHDRNILRTYTGAFIHGSRDTGTDILLLDSIDSVSRFEWAAAFTLRTNNEYFLFGANGKVIEVERGIALRIVNQEIVNIARRIAETEGFETGSDELYSAARKIRVQLFDVYKSAIS